MPTRPVIAALLLALPVSAEERVDYLRSVKPILAARCFACHGALKQKASLRLDTAGLMKQGGENGPAIVAGKSGDSVLLQRVGRGNQPGRMPPSTEGEGLKPAEIALLKAWIDQGANAPADEKPETDPKDHWAFKTPSRPPLPKTKSDVRNPIDRFIVAEQEKRGLIAAGEAERLLLLRRLYLDLTGMPPTPEDVERVRNDKRADWYEKEVDKLLDSPQYGERWGRHWMDVWRYSDWWGLGAEVRNSQKHVWHWRDWIVESLNADKGYDQMLREMLAADELYPEDAEKLRATGYLVRSYFIFNRNSWLDETVEHVSKGFLGVTLNCAKCHDHKYDPFAQRDYYRMRAFFEPYQVRADMVPGEADFAKDALPRVFDCNLETPTFLFERGDEKNPVKTKPIPPGLPAILSGELAIKPVSLPPLGHVPSLRPHVLENHLRATMQRIEAAKAALAAAKKTVAEVEKLPPPMPEPKPAKAAVADDFAKEKPDIWEKRAGKWTWKTGKLLQEQVGGTERAVLRLKEPPPADFEASVKFRILGGEMWKSVGLTFDTSDAYDAIAYLSATAGGPKAQLAYKQGAAYVYPPEAAQARNVPLGEDQELTIRVRGTLVNLSVNGKHALAYRLPERKKGHLAVVTFDAKAEFTAFRLAPLAADAKLVESTKPGTKPAVPRTPEQAKQAVMMAEKDVAIAELEPALLMAKHAATVAKHRQPPAPDAKELAREAAQLEKRIALLTLEKNKAPQAQIDKARKDVENPGETFAPLIGAMKAPESNLESAESKAKPFPATSSGRRSALATWMTDKKNPLTARVAVNHIWMRHFGKPLVPTVFDFGRKGAAPTHPDLLDWLAVELMENKWSMKQIHRLIVTSATYRMSPGAKPQAADLENRWYWKRSPQRMEAQALRDSLLHLAGELDLKRGGPTIPANDEASNRRSLYFFHSHNEYSKFLSIFDDANVLECYRRAESVVPQQALALANSKMALASAEKIAKRLEPSADDAVFIRSAFELLLGATPTKEEQSACAEALKEWRVVAPARARANLVHALLNHNDFITIR